MTTFDIIFFLVMFAVLIYFIFFSKKVYPSENPPAIATIDVNSMDAGEKQLPPFNREKLKTWYMGVATDHQLAAKKEICIAKVVMVVQFVFTPILYFAVIRDTGKSTEEQHFFSMSNWELLASMLLYAVLFSQYQWLLRRPVYNHLKKDSFDEIKEGRFQQIWDISKQLTFDLGLSHHQLRIYYIKTNQFETHINFSDGCIHLFISRAAMSLTTDDGILLKSILANEFGHVYQKDDKLFLINKTLLTWPGKIALFSTLFNAVISILAMLNCVLLSGAASIPAILFIRAYSEVNKKRKQAENLADICSLAYVPGSKIGYLIEKLSHEEYTSGYPSKAERLTFIEKTLAKVGQ